MHYHTKLLPRRGVSESPKIVTQTKDQEGSFTFTVHVEYFLRVSLFKVFT